MPAWVGPVAAYMAQGLAATLFLALVCSVASIALGTILGVAMIPELPPLRRAVRLYIELWRGLPLIVILFFVFFALPAIGLRLNALSAAATGLTLWGSAVVADNVRGAIQSIPRSQFEGARALGLGWFTTMWCVVLPQAVRRVLPPTLNLLTSLIHGTSLAAQLGALELLESARRSIQRLVLDLGQPHSLPIFGAVMVVFFVVCYPLILLSRQLERRLRV